MPDIAMCRGEGCPLKETCYRFTATPTPGRQSYFMTTPRTVDGHCSYLIPLNPMTGNPRGRLVDNVLPCCGHLTSSHWLFNPGTGLYNGCNECNCWWPEPASGVRDRVPNEMGDPVMAKAISDIHTLAQQLIEYTAKRATEDEQRLTVEVAQIEEALAAARPALPILCGGGPIPLLSVPPDHGLVIDSQGNLFLVFETSDARSGPVRSVRDIAEVIGHGAAFAITNALRTALRRKIPASKTGG